MSELLRKHLVHYDPVHLGLTRTGIANAMMLSLGFSFLRVAGGYNLYRGAEQKSAIDWDSPVGAAAADATSIRNFPWISHAADEDWVYGVRAIGGGGVEEQTTHNCVRARFDGAGDLRDAVPNAPFALAAVPGSGGTLAVEWLYSAAGQEVAPSVFRVYHDNGTGTMDWVTPIGSVSYVAGVQAFSFATGAYSHGTRVQVGVRAESAAGDEETSTRTVTTTAIATPPAALAFVHAREAEAQV